MPTRYIRDIRNSIMQKYTYHTHNNFEDIFDGSSSCEDMIAKAVELGFEEIGISNHFIVHPNMSMVNKMFFNDSKLALDIYKRSYDEIDRVATKYPIKVLKGFEVDFFPSSTWRNMFEKMIKELNPDYLIGSTHFVRNNEETEMYNIYYLEQYYKDKSPEKFNLFLTNYWNNIISAVESGYFNFIAHLDYCTLFNLSVSSEWNDIKYKLIETLIKYNQPFEINTKGIERINRTYPENWIIEELVKANVPVLISDDAHSTDRIGDNFECVENFLNKINCKNRYKI